MESLTNTFSAASQNDYFNILVWLVFLIILDDDAKRKEKRRRKEQKRRVLIEEQKKPVPVPKNYGYVPPF